MTTAEPITLTRHQARGQSLANGAAGIALLHIELALAGRGPWADAHAAIRRATASLVDAGDHAGLYYGAPAVTFMLHAAQTGGPPKYARELVTLDSHLARLARRRLHAAADRIDAGEYTQFGEYDLFYGMVGIGVLLRVRNPGSDIFGDVLRYLVRLTHPIQDDGMELPGWWVPHDPDPILPTPGGHANLGMAHGAAGILALLALAAIDGYTVDGHHEALHRLTGLFQDWRQDSPEGPWWPQWITRTELRTHRPAQPGPGRPSWCYGTPGIARALQLAALATGDVTRQRDAEHALLTSLTDPNLERLTEPGLCHGVAGLYQTVYRAARDSTNPDLHHRLPTLAAILTQRNAHQDSKDGLLTGRAGAELAMETGRQAGPPRSGWDACLLIT